MRFKSKLAALSAFLLVANALVVVDARAQPFPPLISSLPSGAPPSAPAMPAYLGSIYDAKYGGQITRITDVNGYRTGTQHMSAWSCNGTYIALLTGRRLLRASDFKDLARYGDIMPADGVTPWSNVNDDLMYGASYNKNVIRTYQPSTNTTGILYTFQDYKVTPFSTTGNVSKDDRTMFLVGQKSDNSWWFILFNPRDKVIIKEKKIVHPVTNLPSSYPKHYACSHSGTYMTVGWGNNSPAAESGNWVLDRDLNYITGKMSSSHFDHGIEYGTGKELLVYSTNYYYILPAGPQVPILPYGTAAGEHVSCQGPDGWVYFSDFQYRPNDPGTDLIARVRLDGTGAAQVWGYAHATHDDPNMQSTDVAAPYPNPSRDGRKVLFSSKWGAPSSPVGDVFAYQVAMPEIDAGEPGPDAGEPDLDASAQPGLDGDAATAGTGGSPGKDADSSGGDVAIYDGGDPEGCACRSAGVRSAQTGTLGWGLLVLGLGWAIRRRERLPRRLDKMG